jgi:hypothetical protein
MNLTYNFFKRNTNPAGLFQQVSLVPHKGYRRYALKHKSIKATVENICFKGTASPNFKSFECRLKPNKTEKYFTTVQR